MVISAQPADGLQAARLQAVDEVVVDLTAVPPGERTDFLRLQVATAIGGTTWRAPTVSVQIAPFGTMLFDEDIIQLIMFLGGGLDSLVVPEVGNAEPLVAASELLDEIESEFPVDRHLRLKGRISGAVDTARMADIVAATPRLVEVVFDADVRSASTEPELLSVVRRAGISAVRGMPGVRRPGLLPDDVFDGHWTFEPNQVRSNCGRSGPRDRRQV
jgi:citrate lyase beta subunit